MKILIIGGTGTISSAITRQLAATTPRNLHPDSLLVFTRRTVLENPFLTGLAISMEPYYFPEKGRYYSAYSLRHKTPMLGGMVAETDTNDITTRMKESAKDISRLTSKLKEAATNGDAA